MNKRTQKSHAPNDNNSSRTTANDDNVLLDELRAAIPNPSDSDEDARAWLDSFDHSIALPPSLTDVDSAVDSIFNKRIREPNLEKGLFQATAQSLRRAARNGNEITNEIEEAMRQARASTKPRVHGTRPSKRFADRISPNRREEIIELAEMVAGDEVPVDPSRILSSIPDISIAFGSFGDAYDGLIENRDGGFWIYCNQERTGHRDSARSRFTLAHEAGHYFIDEHRIALQDGGVHQHVSATDYESSDLAEREADLFAAHLLMPRAPFSAAMRRAALGAPGVLSIADRFNTSVTSTALRYVGCADFMCVVVKWTSSGLGWRWSSREAVAGRYLRTVQSLSDLPVDSATRLVAAGMETEAGFVERGTVASTWFDYVSAGGSRDEILMEHAISLGRFGFLTLLFPVALSNS